MPVGRTASHELEGERAVDSTLGSWHGVLLTPCLNVPREVTFFPSLMKYLRGQFCGTN